MASTSNEELVREFFSAMEPTLEDFKENFRIRFSDDVVWESVGFPARHGRRECIEYIDVLHSSTGMEYCTVEILNVAAAGDVVLTERIDTMFRADGTEIRAFRIMAAIEVKDGRITRYTDYFDTARYAPQVNDRYAGVSVTGNS